MIEDTLRPEHLRAQESDSPLKLRLNPVEVVNEFELGVPVKPESQELALNSSQSGPQSRFKQRLKKLLNIEQVV